MNQTNNNLADSLDDIIDKSLEVDPSLICQIDGCDRLGSIYQYPSMDDESEPETAMLCSGHAKQFGFCHGCGGFFGGMEDFDFDSTPLCSDCQSELNADDVYYSHDDPMVDPGELEY